MKCKLNIGIRKLKQATYLELLSNYKTYSKIKEQLNISTSAISRAFHRYIKNGWINRDRSLTEEGLHLVQQAHSSSRNVKSIKPDMVRGHAFTFVLKKPDHIKRWNGFQEYLELKDIKFKKISSTIEGERIIINNRKIWRTRKGFVFYMGKNQSYIGDDAYESFYKVILDVFDIIHQLEKIMHESLKSVNGYQLRCSRGHYALMKNALAQQYGKEKKKLYVYDTKGMWLIIDDSNHIAEAEITRPDKDTTTAIQDHFNYVKDHPNILPEIDSRITKLSESQLNLVLLIEQLDSNMFKIVKKVGDNNG